MSRDLDAVLASIDGALADDEFPDAMRWSPEPETVDAPAPFDGETVWQPPQRYEGVGSTALDRVLAGVLPDPGRPWTDPASSPLADIRRAAELHRRRVEHREGCSIVHEYLDRPPACQCGALDRAALAMPRQHGRGLPADHLIVDELYLVDPAHRAEVEEERRQVRDRLVERIGVGFSVPPDLRPSARCTIEPVFGTAIAAAQDYERAREALARVFAETAERLRPLMESLGRAAAAAGVEVTKFVEAFTAQALQQQQDRPPSPLPDLRRVDPQGYALQLRQSRGTGPDRQVQRQHRPRRHR